MADDDNPWWSEIRKAFGIRRQVSDENAEEMIARQVVDAVRAAGERGLPWHDMIGPARQTVKDFLESATAGQFDLPLSGFGSIRHDGGRDYTTTPADDVVEVMRMRADGWRTTEDQERVEWLWKRLLAEVDPEARLQEIREHGI